MAFATIVADRILSMNKLVSYCIFSYNQEQYIKEALEGAFKQTYSPLEIIISDDCSTDETYNIITEITKNYKGKHKILINKNEKNLGIGGNFAFVAYSLAKGEYLITVGGDDISKEDHVEKAIQNILDHPGIFMMDFNADIINENGSLIRNIPLEFDCKKFCLEEYLNLKPIKSFAPGRIINMNQLKIMILLIKVVPLKILY
jgi:glycosyltransferase involved in cell wall biosynthesis